MLKKIDIDYLWEGLVLCFDVYDSSGRVLLLNKGETLTDEKINKLKKFNPDDCRVSIDYTYYDEIMSGLDAPVFIRERLFEDNFGYTRLCHEIESLFSMWVKHRYIDSDQAMQIMRAIYKKSEESSFADILQCIQAPRKKQDKLYRHSLNVAFLNAKIGSWLKLSDEDIKMLILSGFLHDVGKIKLFSALLNSKGMSEKEEIEMLKKHPVYSYDMLSLYGRFDERVCMAVRTHHENMGGGGYPEGVESDEIPVFGRITSLSNVYDNAVSSESYDDKKNCFTVYRQLYEQEFGGLDMQLVNIFLKNMMKELVNTEVLLSSGKTAVIKKMFSDSLDYPIVDFNGYIRKTDEELYCKQIFIK